MIAVGMPCPTENDSDGDGVNDIDEVACAGDPFDPNIQPEIIGNGADEDGDGFTDEPLLYEDNEHFDCDGDGYSGYIEHHVYGKSIFAASNQAPCGAAADDPGYFSPGWPADLAGGWSAHRVNVLDMGAFITPVRRLDTALGDADFHVRFDLVPDNRIDLQDLGSLLNVETPMLGGGRAFNGPPCPWAD